MEWRKYAANAPTTTTTQRETKTTKTSGCFGSSPKSTPQKHRYSQKQYPSHSGIALTALVHHLPFVRNNSAIFARTASSGVNTREAKREIVNRASFQCSRSLPTRITS